MTDSLQRNGVGGAASNGTGGIIEYKESIRPANELLLRQTHLGADTDSTAKRSNGMNSVRDSSQNSSSSNSSNDRLTVIGPQSNPFVYKCKISRTIDKVTNILFTVFVLPIRVTIIFGLLILAWALATIGLWGLTIKDIGVKPLERWRRTIRHFTALTLRGLYIVGSFHNVKIIGRRATRREAPILAMAPHSSFFDSMVPVWLNPLSVLAKAETATVPFFGKFINFTQPLYVWREDSTSRQSTIKCIIDRATSKEDWPQIIIFPEGTCTNRSCLITFKNGAFFPGVPVQPVCIRYPNELDTVTWTWEGPGVFRLLWLTLCRIHSRCEIEFLPVYVPSEEERNNPKLYASNVRLVMAKALGVPISDYNYNDCKLMSKARQLNVPHVTEIVDIQKLRQRVGLAKTNIEEQVVSSYLVHENNYLISLTEFALRLQISVEDPSTKELFDIFDTNSTNTIDFRRYLHCALYIIKSDVPVIDLIQLVSKMYDDCGKGPGRLTRNALNSLLTSTMASSIEDSLDIFSRVDVNHRDFITIDELTNYLRSKPEYEFVFNSTDGNNRSTKTPKQQKTL